MIYTEKFNKINKKFYLQPVLTVAKELLGKVIVKQEGDKILSGRIVEVEAYDGKIDQASHSYNGKTKRNEVMFNEGGYFYVYLTYGVHHCCNVVTGKKDSGEAVLIRAVEPIDGIEIIANRRFGKKNISQKEMFNLTSGPGKVCQAFGFNKTYSGLELNGDEVFLINQKKLSDNKIGTSKRIGISKSIDLPWRFFEIGNPYLSRK